MQQRPRTPPSPSGGPRRSEQLRRVPTCPGNVYGEQRHPIDIERDTRCTQMWREMTDEQCRSRSTSSCSDHFQETNPGPSPPHSSDDPDQSLGELLRSKGLKVRCAQVVLRCKWSQGTDTLNDVGSALKKDPKTDVLEKRGYWEGESQGTLRRPKGR